MTCRKVIGTYRSPTHAPMHLLLIHQNFPGQFRDLAPAWLARGHRVTALGSASAPEDDPRWDGLTYVRYRLDGIEEPSVEERGHAVAEACRQLQQKGLVPDLVMVHTAWGESQQLREVFPTTPLVVFPELWGHAEALGFGIDQQLTGQSAEDSWFEQENQLAATAIDESDAAIVACEAQRQSFPLPWRDQLTVLPEGLEQSKYGTAPSAELRWNNHIFAAGQPLVTLVSRNLEPLRGLRQALLAWPAIAAAVPDAQLLLVGDRGQGYGMEAPPAGDDHLSAALKTLPKGVDHQRIHWLGSLDHSIMVRLLQVSACHLALSYPYTLSWSVLEAMACGAALVSNHGSPIARELIDGHNGLLVPFNDHHALAQAVIELLNHPARRAQIGTAALHTIEQRFSLPKSLESFEELFQQLNQNG
tara:strand:- start:1965 stop:3215 length:1251 start_codon:yes stop_codon:yes gene_type:complete